MNQEFINQNPADHAAQGNIYSTDNQFENQGLLPPNQPIAQEISYYPSQNQNNLYDKPINSQNNQIPTPSQPYYPPPQSAIPNQTQPYYPPGQIQGMANPVPQIYPQNNYPPQAGGVIIPTQSAYNAKYENYKNISQINHKGIYQPDENTFYISTGFCFKLFPFIFAIMGVFFMLVPLMDPKGTGGNIYMASAAGVIFFIVGVSLFFLMYNDIYFIMGPNTLTIMKKALCRKKILIYNPGELLRIELNYAYTRRRGRRRSHSHKYSLVIVPKNGKADNIFTIGSSSRFFTNEEIEYFIYFINAHIQTKMIA